MSTVVLGAPLVASENEAIEAAIRGMSPRQQIAQLLFVAFQGTTMSADLERMLGETGVGGVILYGSNIESIEQAARLTTSIRRIGRADWVRAFIGIDQEGGTVVRLASRSGLIPSAMAWGAAASPELTRRGSAAIARMLREVGISVNFAPVLDVSAARNRSLDRRRFGADPELVTALGLAFIAGQRDAGVLPVAKHFPGHGSSTADAHQTLPLNADSERDVWRRDLAPFRAAVADGLEAIMTAHIRVPALAENDRVPATMSRRILTGLLRKELGFDGIVISDEIRMKALQGTSDPAEAAIASLVAGADMIVVSGFPRQRERILAALVEARRTGRLPAERVHQALRRVLAVKHRMANRVPLQPAAGDEDSVFAQIASRAVTLIGNDTSAVPLDPVALQSSLLYIGPRHALPDVLRHADRLVWGGAGSKPVTEDRIADVVSRLPRAVVFMAENEDDLRLATRVRKRARSMPFILIWSGDPYALDTGPDADAYILTYGQHPEAIRTAMRVLVGVAVAQGTLPVHLSRGQKGTPAVGIRARGGGVAAVGSEYRSQCSYRRASQRYALSTPRNRWIHAIR